MFLRQSTASQEITLGYFLDTTDGNTEETGLTIANTDIKLRKGGSTTLTNKNSGGATHISNGIYTSVLDANDTNTLGDLVIYCHPTGALATKLEYTVLPAASYDALIVNGLNDLSAAQVNTEVDTALSDYDGPTNTQMNARTIVSANYATAANLATVDGVVDAILVDTGTTLPATLTDMSGASFSTGTDSLEAIRNRGDAAWVTGAGGSAPTVEQIRTEMDDNSTKLAAILLDTGTTLPASIADVPTVAEFNARTLLAADYFDPASDTVANVTLVDTTTTNTDMLTVANVLTTQMTESYASDGTAPTLAQAVFLTMQNLQDFTYVGTTQTVRQLNGTSTAATYTLDSSTEPTTKTRTT